MMRGALLLALVLLATLGPARRSLGEGGFVEVAEAVGADRPGARCAFVDLDGDGWPDLVIGRRHVLRNVDGKRFEDVTEASGLVIERDGKQRIPDLLTFGDVDNDGDVDVFSGMNCDLRNPKKKDHGWRSRIFLNDGKGRFTVKKDSGVEAHPATTCAATFVDVDGDGVLDLFVGNWYAVYGQSLECYPPRLYRGRGKGKFEDVTEKAGLLGVAEPGRRDSRRPIYGVTHTDWNGDGRVDLLVCAYGRQWNQLWRNDGKGRFTDVGEATGFDGDAERSGKYPDWVRRQTEPPFRANGNTFSCAPADFDNDGDVDLALGEITHGWAGPSSDRTSLLVNQGEKGGWKFRRLVNAGVERKHLHPVNWNQGDMHVAWLDYDLDGLQDLIVSSSDYPDGQRLRLYRQNEDHTFGDVTRKVGLDWPASNAISIADFDRDGDPDILAGRSTARIGKSRPFVSKWGLHRRAEKLTKRVGLWRNDQRTGHHWLGIRITGKKSAIGTRVLLTAGGRTQMREVTGSTGHVGDRNSFALLFGLGKGVLVDRIEVVWPTRNRGKLIASATTNVDRYLEIRQ